MFQRVKAGDTLAIIEAPEVMAKKSQAEAVQTAAKAQNAKAENGARQEQIQGAYELWQKSKVGVEITKKSFERIANLYKEGVVSEQKYDEVKAQYDAAIATEKAAKSQYDMAANGAREELVNRAWKQIDAVKALNAELNQKMVIC